MFSADRAKAIQQIYTTDRQIPPVLIRKLGNSLAKGEELLGAGAYGAVIGVKDKNQKPIAVKVAGQVPKKEIENEINALALAAEMGVAPKIYASTIMPDPLNPANAIGVIEMERMDPSQYKMVGEIYPNRDVNKYYPDYTEEYEGIPNPIKVQEEDDFESEVQQQLAAMYLKNLSPGDRHNGNILVNLETNEPVQIDFGRAETVKDKHAVSQAARIVYDEMKKRGQNDEAEILYGIINELNDSKQYNEAKHHIQEGLDILARTPASQAATSGPDLLPPWWEIQ